jgi:hypothetical protein
VTLLSAKHAGEVVMALPRTKRKQRTNDGLATAAAVVIFLPAAFFVGGDKQTAAELGQMKGQMVAIEQASIQKKCGIQFQGPRPPGTQRDFPDISQAVTFGIPKWRWVMTTS